MSASVDELSASLVREYLSRKGLKLTLARMDEELPRTAGSVNNRATLARALHIEKLMKKNKEGETPLKTMLEVVTKYLLSKSSCIAPHHSSRSTMQAAHQPHHSTSVGGGANEMTSSYFTAPNTGARPRERGVMTGGARERLTCSSSGDNPLITSVITSGRTSKGDTSTITATTVNRGMESRRYDLKPRSMAEWESDQGHTGDKLKPHPNKIQGDILCEDLEVVDLNVGDHMMHCSDTGTGRRDYKRTVGQPISLEEAKLVRKLLFGTAKGPSFNSEWRQQNFTFCDLPSLEYGLVQHKGGPCGVLACVQAYVLKHLLFKRSKSGRDCLQPSPEERNAALVSALADTLWKVRGEEEMVIVALPPSAPAPSHSSRSHSYTPDHITEQVVLHRVPNEDTLTEFLSSHVHTFQGASESGCIHFLISVLLTKGIESIKVEMDNEDTCLIAAYGYCSQELVNLLLTGEAVSNVFNGSINLDSGSAHKNLLRGISRQSEIGFLTLFEHYGNCIVDSHYKSPVYPIWVVCSESHFTVLFSTDTNLLTDRQLDHKFDLYYFDGLANQDEEIRLTLNNATCEEVENKPREKITELDLLPPLELCIRTKWERAVVNWNNTDPLL